MKKKIFIIFIIVFKISYSQQKYKFQGHLNDENKKIISGGRVFIEELNISVLTDKFGHYEIFLPNGNYSVLYSFVGLKSKKHQISINDQDFHLDVEMQEDLLGLDQMLLSYSLENVKKRESINSLNVLENSIIQSSSAPSMFEGLKFQPGIRTFRTCQNCGSSEVSINGLSNEYSQILVNGRPIFSGISSVYGLEQIPTSIIQKIEITKGGGSIYSPYSIGGTINVITNQPLTNEYNTNINFALIEGRTIESVSSFNASIIGDNNKHGIFIFGDLRLRDAHDFDGDDFSELTKNRTATIGVKRFFYYLDQKITTEVINIRENRRGGWMDMHTPNNFSLLSESIISNLYLGGGTMEGSISDNLDYTLSFYFQDNYMTNFYGIRENELALPNVEGNGVTYSKIYLAGNEYLLNIDNFFFGRKKLTFGIDYKYETLEDMKPAYDIKLEQSSSFLDFYINDSWYMNDYISLNLALRTDIYMIGYNDKINRGFFITPRINLKYDITDEYSFKVGYSRGARAPQIYGEKIHSKISGGLINQVNLDNDLKTEYSNSFVSSFIYSPIIEGMNIEFSLDGFFNSIENPFVSEEFISPNNPNVRYMLIRNRSNAKVFGCSFEGKINYLDTYIFQINTTLQESRYKEKMLWSDEVEGTHNFIYTPNVYASMVSIYKFLDKFEININANYTGRQYIPHYKGYIDADRLEYVKDFFDINFKIDYKFSLMKKLNSTFSIFVNNIFNTFQTDLDKTNQRDSGYFFGPSSPRVFGIGLKVKYD